MRVLIVDDHQLFSDGLRVLLQELSPDVHISTAPTIAEALRAVGPFDLILLDLHLPDAQGFDGMKRLRLFHDAVPVVVVSGEENPVHIRDCIDLGAMGFVPKASSSAELFQAMQRVLDGQTYLPPSSMVGLDNISEDDAAQKKSPKVHLSPRQREVLGKVIQGKSNKVIARELGISDTTVSSHVVAVLEALGVHNRTEAVYRAAFFGFAMPKS